MSTTSDPASDDGLVGPAGTRDAAGAPTSTTTSTTPIEPEQSGQPGRSTKHGKGDQPDALRYTRTSVAWAGIVPAVIVLVALVIFIFQNTQRVQVKFLMFDGHPPLAAALLAATALGMVLVALVGTLRIFQLRRRVKKERKAASR